MFCWWRRRKIFYENTRDRDICRYIKQTTVNPSSKRRTARTQKSFSFNHSLCVRGSFPESRKRRAIFHAELREGHCQRGWRIRSRAGATCSLQFQRNLCSKLYIIDIFIVLGNGTHVLYWTFCISNEARNKREIITLSLADVYFICFSF